MNNSKLITKIMKASTLVLMLCIGTMCFTGFGKTTSDLTDNSKIEFMQLDIQDMAQAVVMDVQVDDSFAVVKEPGPIQVNIFKEVSNTSEFDVENTSLQTYNQTALRLRHAATKTLHDNSYNFLLDVGWYNCHKNILTPEITNDPGGVLSTFYS